MIGSFAPMPLALPPQPGSALGFGDPKKIDASYFSKSCNKIPYFLEKNEPEA
ncbi:hypothetical protein [Edaphovirga cremea]|uniref:hypothetical protein n=1 Tax=Edaphovirga cremea TaxID=2267246 RepID=UPI0013003BAA|nr:hypothetical protein [Edaphovirga cremea]